MTDRELLELAAKAAGIRQSGWVDDDPDIEPCIVADDENDCAFNWNPLADDGDAFRLANALHLNVYHAELAVIVNHKQYAWEWMGEGVNEDTGDRNASARRVITRAAAEIGGAKP